MSAVRLLLLFALLTLAPMAWAEDIWSFTIENDMFSGSGKDQNYTNGARLSLLQTEEDAPEFMNQLAKLLPWYEPGSHTGTLYSLGQNMYTPENTSLMTPDPADRPYAAILYGSVGVASANADLSQIDELELMVGVVGPSALGREVQQLVHEAVDAKKPRGWAHQLHDEPILNLTWQRRWPHLYSRQLWPLRLSVEPHVSTALGNAHTYVGTGVTLSLTPKDSPLQDHPLRVRPATPGTGYYNTEKNRLGWSIFSGFEVRAVARDIFLQGNSWQDSPSVTPRVVSGDIQGGVAFTYGRARVAYTTVFRSKEFFGQDDANLFGAISLSWGF